MTTTTIGQQPIRIWQVSSEARALLEKFPPRPAAGSWPMTRQDRTAVEGRLRKAPFCGDDSQSRCHRKASLQAVFDWLELYPGQSWQQRWDASGDSRDGQLTGDSNSPMISPRPG